MLLCKSTNWASKISERILSAENDQDTRDLYRNLGHVALLETTAQIDRYSYQNEVAFRPSKHWHLVGTVINWRHSENRGTRIKSTRQTGWSGFWKLDGDDQFIQITLNCYLEESLKLQWRDYWDLRRLELEWFLRGMKEFLLE